MAKRVSLEGRSPVQWGVRILLAIGAGFLGYGAVAHSLAYTLRGGAIERAHLLAPHDGRFTALLSEKRAGATATAAERVEADRLARLALIQDPTAVAAIATLGINAQIRGDTAAARRLFAFSHKLSRRDLRTRLWLIEDAVGREDVDGALRNYDIALRTSRHAPDLLFPVLANAISDPEIRASLERTLAAQPVWTQGFIDFIPANGPDPRATARLFKGLGRAGVPLSEAARTSIINVLVAHRFVDDAWSYYASQHRGADLRRSRDPRFTASPDHPSLFDWVPAAGNPGILASIQRGEEGGIFDFAAPPSVGGALLQQLQMLPPGSYVLEGLSSGIDQPESSLPYWTLSCLEGRELGRVALPNSAQAKGRFAGRFIVPEGCPVQYLRFAARPSNKASGTSGQLHQALLRPT